MKKIPPLSDAIEAKASMALFKSGDVSLEQWHAFVCGQYSKNTLLSFRNDWLVFVNYCNDVGVSPLPAAVTAVRRFVEKQAETRKAASIKRYIVTISLLHRIHNLADPTRHREVRFTLNHLYQEKADDAAQATAFHFTHLQRLHEMFSHSEKLKDIRDLLIWTLSFEGMLKRSELAALLVEEVSPSDTGYQISVDEYLIALSPQASALLDTWYHLSGIAQGPLLRRINKHNQLGDAAMDHSSIYRVFRRAATELGLEGAITFSGQSPRVGASQNLSENGRSIREIQQQGRWKSPAMPAQYVGNRQARNEAMEKYKRKIEKD